MTDEWIRDIETIFILVEVNIYMCRGAERVLKSCNVVCIYVYIYTFETKM
jgi:hypothetical protein